MASPSIVPIKAGNREISIPVRGSRRMSDESTATITPLSLADAARIGPGKVLVHVGITVVCARSLGTTCNESSKVITQSIIDWECIIPKISIFETAKPRCVPLNAERGSSLRNPVLIDRRRSDLLREFDIRYSAFNSLFAIRYSAFNSPWYPSPTPAV